MKCNEEYTLEEVSRERDDLKAALRNLVKVAEGFTVHADEVCGRIEGECDENPAECSEHGKDDGADHCPECECGVSELQLATTRSRAALAASEAKR